MKNLKKILGSKSHFANESGLGTLLTVVMIGSAAAIVAAGSGTLITYVKNNATRSLVQKEVHDQNMTGNIAFSALVNTGLISHNPITNQWTIPSSTPNPNIFSISQNGGNVTGVGYKLCDPASLSAAQLGTLYTTGQIPNPQNCGSAAVTPEINIVGFTPGNYSASIPASITTQSITKLTTTRLPASGRTMSASDKINLSAMVPTPQCNLMAVQNITLGQSISFVLTTSGIASASSFEGKNYPATGATVSYKPKTSGTQVFTASVFGTGGTNTCSAVVNVYAKPSCTITALPTTLTHGSTVTAFLTMFPNDGLSLNYGYITSSNGLHSANFPPATGSISDTPAIGHVVYTGTVIGHSSNATCSTAVVTVVPNAPACLVTINPLKPPFAYTGQSVYVGVTDVSPNPLFPVTSGTLSWNGDAKPQPVNPLQALPYGNFVVPNGPSPGNPNVFFTASAQVTNADGTLNSCSKSISIASCFIECNGVDTLTGQSTQGPQIIDEFYRQLLARDPQATEELTGITDMGYLAYNIDHLGVWNSLSNPTLGMIDIENSIRSSAEYASNVVDDSGETIIALYRIFYGRFPTLNEIALGRPAQKTWTASQLTQWFESSFSWNGTLHPEPVQELYRRLLGREPANWEIAVMTDAIAGSNYFGQNLPAASAQVGNSMFTWQTMENFFRNSPEYANNGGYPSEQAISYFRGELCRFPGSTAAMQSWSATINQEPCNEFVAQSFRTSQEYVTNGGCSLSAPAACAAPPPPYVPPAPAPGDPMPPGAPPPPPAEQKLSCTLYIHNHYGHQIEWEAIWIPGQPFLMGLEGTPAAAQDSKLLTSTIDDDSLLKNSPVQYQFLQDPLTVVSPGRLNFPNPYKFQGVAYDTGYGYGSADCALFFSENYSPLVVDLLDQGLSLLYPLPGVLFDLMGLGQKEPYSWIKNPQNSQWLVYDKNGNGNIDDINEMFGNNTVGPDGKKAANGFDALAKYDADHDGFITPKDPIYPQLSLWSDLNGDGVVQAGELTSLSSANIKYIDLGYLNVTEAADNWGDQTRERSLVVMADDSIRKIYDLWLVTFDLGKN